MLKHETRSLARAMKVSRNVFKNSITICVARYFFFFTEYEWKCCRGVAWDKSGTSAVQCSFCRNFILPLSPSVSVFNNNGNDIATASFKSPL